MSTEPVQVEIVRPYKSTTDLISTAIAATATTVFLAAYWLMLLIPVVFAWHPGYWQCVALLFGVRLFFVTTSYEEWTRKGTKPKPSTVKVDRLALAQLVRKASQK